MSRFLRLSPTSDILPMTRSFLFILCLLLMMATSVVAQDFDSYKGADTLFAKAETFDAQLVDELNT